MSEYRYQRKLRRGTRLGRLLARLPFSLWLRLMLHMARTNPYVFDNHFRPQCDFVPDGAAVFRLEDGLDRVGSWLATHADATTPRLPRLLSSGDVSPSLADRDQALIAAVFANDYVRFGYPMPTDGKTARPLWDPVAWCLSFPVRALERRGLI